MNIRDAVVEDMRALSPIYRTFWGEDSNVPQMEDTFACMMEKEDYILLCAEEDGEVLGTVMGIVCLDLYGDCKPFLLLENLAVGEKARRKGVARALVAELERRATERGCSQVILVTESDREDACSFYPTVGYHPTANRGFKKKLAK